MGMLNAQELANMAWAFVAAGVRAPGLFAALAAHCEQRMGTFNAQDLANTAWALAAMHLIHSPAQSEATAAMDGAPARLRHCIPGCVW
jgi:hypothetical protein